jgi:hypothetical protein
MPKKIIIKVKQTGLLVAETCLTFDPSEEEIKSVTDELFKVSNNNWNGSKPLISEVIDFNHPNNPINRKEERIALKKRFHSAFVEKLDKISKETDCVLDGKFNLYKDTGDGYSFVVSLFDNPKDLSNNIFKRLVAEKRPDLTIEALVIDNEEWQELFTEKHLKEASRRLKEVDYPKSV